MTYQLDIAVPGYPVIEALVPVAASAPANTPYPPLYPGILATGNDEVYGPGEFVFAKFGGAIRQYGLCVCLQTLNTTTRQFEPVMTEAPNTANTGRSLYVCMTDIGNVTTVSGQYGWFMRAGTTPINGTASVAAGTTVGITAAGQIGANSAGKQVLNAVSIQAATATVVRAAAGSGNNNLSGGFTIQTVNVDGFFVGGFLSGTGVGASAVINAIDRINNVLTVTVANSAAVTGNITQTNNNATIFYNVVQIDRAFVQGAIT